MLIYLGNIRVVLRLIIKLRDRPEKFLFGSFHPYADVKFEKGPCLYEAEEGEASFSRYCPMAVTPF